MLWERRSHSTTHLDTGLCEPLWSIRQDCQLMAKLETQHILQAQMCDCISTKNETGN